MDTKTLGDVLRFISQHETLSQVEESFPDYSLNEVRDALAALASKVSPQSSGSSNAAASKSGIGSSFSKYLDLLRSIITIITI